MEPKSDKERRHLLEHVEHGAISYKEIRVLTVVASLIGLLAILQLLVDAIDYLGLDSALIPDEHIVQHNVRESGKSNAAVGSQLRRKSHV